MVARGYVIWLNAAGLGRLAQPLELGDPGQPLQGALFDAPRLGDRHAEVPGRLLDGPLALAIGAEPGTDDLHLLRGQGSQAGAHDALGLAPDRLVLEGLLVDRQQGAERRLAVLADTGVERGQHLLVAAQPLDLLGVGVQLLRQLFQRGLTAQAERHLALGPAEAPHALRDVRRQADGAARVVQAALERLPDPDRRVRREP